MSLKKITLFCCLCFLINVVFAQIKMVKVGLSPAVAITPNYSIAIQPSAEFSLSKKIKLLTEFTIPFNNFEKNRDFSGINFFKTKAEIRYHIKPIKPLYIGLQMAYTYRKFDAVTKGRFYEKKYYDTVAYLYQSATISSPVLTISMQVGWLIKFFSRFYGDFFLGAGYRNVNTTYSNINGLQKINVDRPKDSFFFSPEPAHQINRIVHRLQVNGGFRLLYQLHK